jgi:sirohydrochlorin ferrochelatase
MEEAGAEILLVDNGSLRPEAILQHRRIARALGRKVRRSVTAVSVLHSSAVPATKLRGQRAELLEPALRRRAEKGARNFLIVPLFVGPSRAVTEYIPARVRALRNRFPGLRVRITPQLAASGDARVAQIVADNVRASLARFRGRAPFVAVVDHGSPSREVTRVRDRIAADVRKILGPSVARVAACSMERRPGMRYAFGEPLLESLLDSPDWRSERVVVAPVFLLPGRHAGPRGDIAEICRRARAKRPRLRIVVTKLIGSSPRIVELLAARAAG